MYGPIPYLLGIFLVFLFFIQRNSCFLGIGKAHTQKARISLTQEVEALRPNNTPLLPLQERK
jgi:hypothetical protein